jgi:hypothetical protein
VEPPCPPVQGGQDELRCYNTGERASTGLRAKTPQSVRRVVDERHTEPLGKHPHVDLLLVTPLQWDAAVALTGSFGLDRPSGPVLKFVGVELESFENQMVTFLPDILAEHPAPDTCRLCARQTRGRSR